MGNFTISSKKYGEYQVLFDDEDTELVNKYKWRIEKKIYTCYAITWTPMINGKRKSIRMHNLIMGYNFIDHINGNGLDNRKANLRNADHRKNAQNRQKSGKKNKSSKYKGVFYNNMKNLKNRWQSRIHVNGKSVHLGSFATELQAANAYKEASIEYFETYAWYDDDKIGTERE